MHRRTESLQTRSSQQPDRRGYICVHHSLELYQLALPWSLVCADGSGCVLGCRRHLERCSHLQYSWESSTLGSMCLVPLRGSDLLFLIDGAQALEERSFRFWKGCCVMEGKKGRLHGHLWTVKDGEVSGGATWFGCSISNLKTGMNSDLI